MLFECRNSGSSSLRIRERAVDVDGINLVDVSNRKDPVQDVEYNSTDEET
jgi:hypothetical protein